MQPDARLAGVMPRWGVYALGYGALVLDARLRGQRASPRAELRGRPARRDPGPGSTHGHDLANPQPTCRDPLGLNFATLLLTPFTDVEPDCTELSVKVTVGYT